MAEAIKELIKHAVQREFGNLFPNREKKNESTADPVIQSLLQTELGKYVQSSSQPTEFSTSSSVAPTISTNLTTASASPSAQPTPVAPSQISYPAVQPASGFPTFSSAASTISTNLTTTYVRPSAQPTPIVPPQMSFPAVQPASGFPTFSCAAPAISANLATTNVCPSVQPPPIVSPQISYPAVQPSSSSAHHTSSYSNLQFPSFNRRSRRRNNNPKTDRFPSYKKKTYLLPGSNITSVNKKQRAFLANQKFLCSSARYKKIWNHSELTNYIQRLFPQLNGKSYSLQFFTVEGNGSDLIPIIPEPGQPMNAEDLQFGSHKVVFLLPSVNLLSEADLENFSLLGRKYAKRKRMSQLSDGSETGDSDSEPSDKNSDQSKVERSESSDMNASRSEVRLLVDSKSSVVQEPKSPLKVNANQSKLVVENLLPEADLENFSLLGKMYAKRKRMSQPSDGSESGSGCSSEHFDKNADQSEKGSSEPLNKDIDQSEVERLESLDMNTRKSKVGLLVENKSSIVQEPELPLEVNVNQSELVSEESSSVTTPHEEETYLNIQSGYVFQDQYGVSYFVPSSSKERSSDTLSFSASDELFRSLKETLLDDTQRTLQFKRGNLLSQTIDYIKKGKLSGTTKLKVEFQGESPDHGGPRREYLTELMEEIRFNDVYFDGNLIAKSVKYNQEFVEDKIYVYIGQIILMSLLNDGPGPKCFSALLYKSLHSNLDKEDFKIENIPDQFHVQGLLRLKGSLTYEDVVKAFAEENVFSLPGLPAPRGQKEGPLEALKDKIITSTVTYLLRDRIEKPITQLKEGLGPFISYIQHNHYLLADVFVGAERRDLTAEVLLQVFECYVPPDELAEIAAYKNWRTFLKECEDGKTKVSLAEVLKFGTGLKDLPPQNFSPKPTLHFLDEFAFMPTGATCPNEIYLPLCIDYEVFKDRMETGVKGANGLICKD